MEKINRRNNNLSEDTSLLEDVNRRSTLVAVVQKLGDLREQTESTFNAIGSLAAEETLIKNIPSLGLIADGGLKNCGNSRSTVNRGGLETRIAALPEDVIQQSLGQITTFLGTINKISTYASAKRLEPYLRFSVPSTRAGFTTLKLIAQQFFQSENIPDDINVGNISELTKILNKLDERLKVAAADNEEVVAFLRPQTIEQAQLRLARYKQGDSNQLLQIKGMIAEQKLAQLRREPVVREDSRECSVFEVLVNQIITDENLAAEIEVAQSKSREFVDKAKETAIFTIAKKRATNMVMQSINEDALLCQALARRQRLSAEELLDADEKIKRQAANKALNAKRFIISVEERRAFDGQIIIAEEITRFREALNDPLPLIVTLSDEELVVIRNNIPRISESKSIFDLAKNRLKEQLMDGVTDDEIIEHLMTVIVNELLSTKSAEAINSSITELGVEQSLVLQNSKVFLEQADEIVTGALKYLARDSFSETEVIKEKAGGQEINPLRNLQEDLTTPNIAKPIIVGKSEVIPVDPESKGARKVEGVLRRLVDIGVLKPTFGRSSRVLGSAIMHKANTTIFINTQLDDEKKYFIHARVLAQSNGSKYGWADASSLADMESVDVVSGLCLFSSPAVSVIGESSTAYPLTNPYVNGSIAEQIIGIKADKRLQPYEIDSIHRLSGILSSLSPEKVDTVALAVPRLEYYFYGMDLYEKGLIDNTLILEWFNLVDKRADIVARLIKKRINQIPKIEIVSPLVPVEKFIKDEVGGNKKGLLPKVTELLSDSDEIWRILLEAEPESATSFGELSYLSYTIGYLNRLKKKNNLLVVENLEEVGILNRTRSLIGKIRDQAMIVGLYVHSNVIMNEDPEILGGRTLYFFDPKERYKTVMAEIVRSNK